MAILNQESSLMEIVKLIGGDVLPDDQKLILEIAKVIRLGFLQQNAFHKDDTCVSLEKQFKMMDVILYLYKTSRKLVAMGMPMSVLKAEGIFEKVIAIKYDGKQLPTFQYRRHWTIRGAAHWQKRDIGPFGVQTATGAATAKHTMHTNLIG